MGVHIFLAFLILSFSTLVLAQVDPTSSLLLRQSGTGSGTAGYESGRFIVQPTAPRPQSAVQSPTSNATVAPTATPAPQKQVMTSVQDDKKNKIKAEVEDPTPRAENTEKLHPQDIRNNMVRLSLAPAVTYFDSSSDYWFRDYNGNGMALSAGVDVWFSTNLGIHADYITSFGASINAEHASAREAVVDMKTSRVALQMRSYYGLSRKAPSVTFGIGSYSSDMSVPKSESQRIGVKSAGPMVFLSAHVPSGIRDSWIYGVEFLPNLKVDEEATGVRVKSGTSHKSFGLQLSVGKEFFLDRKNQLFWRLSHQFEKTIYSGASNTQDPRSLQMPSDISVNSGISLFEFGYAWGD